MNYGEKTQYVGIKLKSGKVVKFAVERWKNDWTPIVGVPDFGGTTNLVAPKGVRSYPEGWFKHYNDESSDASLEMF